MINNSITPQGSDGSDSLSQDVTLFALAQGSRLAHAVYISLHYTISVNPCLSLRLRLPIPRLKAQVSSN